MFFGHVNDIPENSFKVMTQDKNKTCIINKQNNYFLQNNICTHQGSRLLSGEGKLQEIVCPYHGFTWDNNGEPINSGTVGHSKGSSVCKNTAKLWQNQCYNWNSFLFNKYIPVDIDIAGNYKLVEYRKDSIESSYISIMDLFLDVDHIPTVHPNVYDKIDIPNVEDIEWKTWIGGSAQLVTGDPGKAAWIALYPYTMFEWQPGAVFVMVNQPIENAKTVSHVFKYRDYNYDQKNWELNELVWETAWEQDRKQAELLEPGWRTAGEMHLDIEKKNFRKWI